MIKKNKFIILMKRYLKLREVEDKINDAFKGLCSDFSQFSLSNHDELILDILENLFNDKHNDWIGYWLYDLNCGKDWKKGKITAKNGKDIPLKTLTDLYNVLVENYKENNK